MQTLYVLPIISGSVSLLGSGAIAAMILMSAEKLSRPFRRLIFGLSVMDIIQSLAMTLGPFSLPADLDGVLWSMGNTTTCDIQGFALHIGFAGVPMYMLSLTIYYLYVIKFSMKDKIFSTRIEPWLHLVSIGWTIGGGIACWATGSFNMMESGNICWYTPSPHDCVANDDVDCVRGAHAFAFGWIFGGSNFATLCCIIYCLHEVCRTVIEQEEKNDRYRFRGSVCARSEPLRSSVPTSESSESRRASFVSLASSIRRIPSLFKQILNSEDIREPNLENVSSSILTSRSYAQRAIEKSEKRKRETKIQASLYVYAFLFTCIWAYIYGFLVTIGVSVPYIIIFLFSVFYPLGGFFNILVYTRPKINSVRKKNTGLSWFRSFALVIRAGGDVPSSIPIMSSSQNSYSGIDYSEENGKWNVWKRKKKKSSNDSDFVDPASINHRFPHGRSSLLSVNGEAILECLREDHESDEEESKEEVQSGIKEWRSMLSDKVSPSLKRSLHEPKELGSFLEFVDITDGGRGKEPTKVSYGGLKSLASFNSVVQSDASSFTIERGDNDKHDAIDREVDVSLEEFLPETCIEPTEVSNVGSKSPSAHSEVAHSDESIITVERDDEDKRNETDREDDASVEEVLPETCIETKALETCVKYCNNLNGTDNNDSQINDTC